MADSVRTCFQILDDCAETSHTDNCLGNRLPPFIEPHRNLQMDPLQRNRDSMMRPLLNKFPKKVKELINESGVSRQSSQSMSRIFLLSVITVSIGIDY